MSEDIMDTLARKKARDAKLRRIEQEKNKIRKSAAECFSTDSGKIVLKWLMKECGYQSCSVIYDAATGSIRKEATVFNEAKRDLYLRLRGLLSSRPDILIEAEIKQQGEDDEQ